MVVQQFEYSRLLKQIAKSNLPAELKIEQTAQILNQVLQESMEYTSDHKTYQHVKTFSDRNDQHLDLIYEDVRKHLDTLKAGQKVKFIFHAMRQPYFKNFVELIPKVEAKMNRKFRQAHQLSRFYKLIS